MRKLTLRFMLYLGIGILCFMIGFVIVTFLFQDGIESSKPDQDGWILDSNITRKETMVHIEVKKKIVIEFLSVNYLEDKEYLMRVEIGGEQVGVIYFDENGEIRFDGDKEKFEDAIFKAFDAPRVK